MLEELAAVDQQKESTHATEVRLERLCEDIREIKGHDDNENECYVPNKRRDSVDRKQAHVLQHVRELRNRISCSNRSS